MQIKYISVRTMWPGDYLSIDRNDWTDRCGFMQYAQRLGLRSSHLTVCSNGSRMSTEIRILTVPLEPCSKLSCWFFCFFYFFSPRHVFCRNCRQLNSFKSAKPTYVCIWFYLGFLEGVTLGTQASIEGVWAYGWMKRHRNNLSHTHNF